MSTLGIKQMSIVTIGKIISNKDLTRSCEVMFDGRTIAHLQIPTEGEPYLEMVQDAKQEDVNKAEEIIKKEKYKNIYDFAYSKYDIIATKEKNVRIINKKMKKNTLFVPKNINSLKVVKHPYSESVRRYISDKYPGAVILNTLSEDDALKLYIENKSNELKKEVA